MKIPDEMCNAMFAKLPLEDKRWLILFAEEVEHARD